MRKSIILVATLLASSMLAAAQGAPNVLPPGSNAYGMGYDELATAWTEWVTAIPNDSSPLFDTDGSLGAVGQGGKVWFLAGTLGDTATRTISVPAGKALFFPVVNYFWVNTPELGDNPWSAEQEAYARSVLAYYLDTAQNLVLQVDGKTIPNVYEFLRVLSTVGTCNLPPVDQNLWGANPGPHPCVADGFWALLPPMSTGTHTIHVAGGLSLDPAFALNITFYLKVGPQKKK